MKNRELFRKLVIAKAYINHKHGGYNEELNKVALEMMEEAIEMVYEEIKNNKEKVREYRRKKCKKKN
jgi:hypothetical protein